MSDENDDVDLENPALKPTAFQLVREAMIAGKVTTVAEAEALCASHGVKTHVTSKP